jgi:hypothetical protein
LIRASDGAIDVLIAPNQRNKALLKVNDCNVEAEANKICVQLQFQALIGMFPALEYDILFALERQFVFLFPCGDGEIFARELVKNAS